MYNQMCFQFLIFQIPTEIMALDNKDSSMTAVRFEQDAIQRNIASPTTQIAKQCNKLVMMMVKTTTLVIQVTCNKFIQTKMLLVLKNFIKLKLPSACKFHFVELKPVKEKTNLSFVRSFVPMSKKGNNGAISCEQRKSIYSKYLSRNFSVFPQH